MDRRGEDKNADAEGHGAKKSGLASTSYSDGAPVDSLSYLEAKLILKAEWFTSADDFRDFGKIVKTIASQTDVGFEQDAAFHDPPEIREIVFLDTTDFALYGSAFILRRRIAYKEGFPVDDPEIVLKYRNTERAKTAALDMRPKIPGKYRIKFKAEILPLRDKIGGYRILYSHNCEFGLSQTVQGDSTPMATFCRIFPALSNLHHDAESVTLVNGGIVEEVLLPIGVLDFGKGMVAKCDVSLWRTRGQHRSLVGEFAFQAKLVDESAVDGGKRRWSEFYIALQRAVADRIELGVTKTAMVYRLNGFAPQSHE